MSTKIEHVRDFWDAHPCESTLSEQKERSVYFTQIQCKRYQLESHIPILAKFDQFRDRDVLEIGCGIGCDGLQFARNGARYVGVDLSPKSVQHAREQFELFGTSGRFEVMNAEKLDFASAAFDHVYSFGVIHHSPDTDAIVREIYRVLKPGGTFVVMVYNKISINYYVQILLLRRLFRLMLYPRRMSRFLAKVSGVLRSGSVLMSPCCSGRACSE